MTTPLLVERSHIFRGFRSIRENYMLQKLIIWLYNYAIVLFNFQANNNYRWLIITCSYVGLYSESKRAAW